MDQTPMMTISPISARSAAEELNGVFGTGDQKYMLKSSEHFFVRR
jgi:hypothetical protein